MKNQLHNFQMNYLLDCSFIDYLGGNSNPFWLNKFILHKHIIEESVRN